MGRYYDYDLSTMANTRGGFIESTDLPAKVVLQERPVALDSDRRCMECGSLDVDDQMEKGFGVRVCYGCKSEKLEKYALLTKTEVRADYLLTEPELRDGTRLPVLFKPNRKRGHGEIWLYMRKHVEEFAVAKYGSLEALDEEHSRRACEKETRKRTRFEKKVAELRRSTRTSVWKEDEHVHTFATHSNAEICACGLVVPIERL